MDVTGTDVNCRIGTVRLPRPGPAGAAELAGAVELELAHLLRLAPVPVPPAGGVVHWPRQVVTAPPSSSPAALARLIATQIHRQLQRGGTW
jgi:hypothetical protein